MRSRNLYSTGRELGASWHFITLTLTAIWDCVRLRTSAQAHKLQAGGPAQYHLAKLSQENYFYFFLDLIFYLGYSGLN